MYTVEYMLYVVITFELSFYTIEMTSQQRMLQLLYCIILLYGLFSGFDLSRVLNPFPGPA